MLKGTRVVLNANGEKAFEWIGGPPTHKSGEEGTYLKQSNFYTSITFDSACKNCAHLLSDDEFDIIDEDVCVIALRNALAKVRDAGYAVKCVLTQTTEREL